MLKHSVFIADWPLRPSFGEPDREYVCPDCGRRIVFDWGCDAEREGMRSEKKLFVPEAAQ